MKKKIMAIIAVAAMVVTMIPSMVFAAQTHTVSNEAELISAIASVDDGGTITLTNNIELKETLIIDRQGTFTIDGNGFSITQHADYQDTWNALIFLGDTTAPYRNDYVYNIKNVVFDGIEEWSVIRSEGVTFTMDGCTIKNCENTKGNALLRLEATEATVVDTTIIDNEALMAITHNWNSDNTVTKLKVEECVIKDNIFNDTAAVYYVVGAGCIITKTEFINNEVNCNNNGSVVYLGDENSASEVTDCLFKDNEVKDSSNSTRVAGAIFFKDDAKITRNAFENNSASNANGSDGLGQNLCMKIYENCTVDLNGNYWGGGEPVEGEDYFVQEGKNLATFTPITEYYTSYEIGEDGNVKFEVAPEPNDGAEGEKVPAPAAKPEKSPKTGDNSVAPFAVAGLVLAAMAAAAVARRRYN